MQEQLQKIDEMMKDLLRFIGETGPDPSTSEGAAYYGCFVARQALLWANDQNSVLSPYEILSEFVPEALFGGPIYDEEKNVNPPPDGQSFVFQSLTDEA